MGGKKRKKSVDEGRVQKRKKPNDLFMEELSPAEKEEYQQWGFITRDSSRGAEDFEGVQEEMEADEGTENKKTNFDEAVQKLLAIPGPHPAVMV